MLRSTYQRNFLIFLFQPRCRCARTSHRRLYVQTLEVRTNLPRTDPLPLAPNIASLQRREPKQRSCAPPPAGVLTVMS